MVKANGNETTVSSGQDRTPAFMNSWQLCCQHQTKPVSDPTWNRVAHTSLPQDEELMMLPVVRGERISLLQFRVVFFSM